MVKLLARLVNSITLILQEVLLLKPIYLQHVEYVKQLGAKFGTFYPGSGNQIAIMSATVNSLLAMKHKL